MSPKDWANLLQTNGLPPAPGTPLDARWIARNDDWWVRTAEGWYWLDRRQGWVRAPQGPP